ncbi:uncharacterized protein DS421_1g20810 [Arachis hypogaea]|nr:uncharacterized protein DS421_1g20810 [Arachis hypogaea]
MSPQPTPDLFLSPLPKYFGLLRRRQKSRILPSNNSAPVSSGSQSRLEASNGPLIVADCVLPSLRRHHRHRFGAVPLVSQRTRNEA